MPEDKGYKILGIGNPFYDRFAFVDDAFLIRQGLIKGDTAILTDRHALERLWDEVHLTSANHAYRLGGSCANVIKMLAVMGHSCALSGILGDDDIGITLRSRLQEAGVIPLMTIGRQATGVVNCLITPDTQRTMQCYLGAASEMADKKLVQAHFEGIIHLHIEGYCAYYGDVLEESLSLAKVQGAKFSLDLAGSGIVQKYRERLNACIPAIDMIFGNAHEMEALCGTSSLKDAIETFSAEQTIVATEGARGCWVKGVGETIASHYDALNIADVVDTTGAGDYFDAGFLHGTLLGKETADCVAMGNAAASMVIRQLGADLPVGKWKELSSKIQCLDK